MQANPLVCRNLGTCEYQPVLQAMKDFTDRRTPDCRDELWSLQHTPVYTLGRAANRANLLNVGDIPVVQVDRGGDVTYHGPGQLVVYLMANLPRLQLNVRQMVTALEQSVVDLLQLYEVASAPRSHAPGVYVGDAKIASLGLRVRRGCTYHGLALNLQMDMAPWAGINACALGVPVTQLSDQTGKTNDCETIAGQLTDILAVKLGYSERQQAPAGKLLAQMETYARSNQETA